MSSPGILSMAAAFLGKGKVVHRPANALKAPADLYKINLKGLNGDPLSLEKYRGKKLLIINVASKCGFTPQYKDLQKLNEQYGDKVALLGCPANNFREQERGTAEEIAEFCEINYGVTFQLSEKLSVKGADQHPLYRWLTHKESNGWNTHAPEWNFCKYLINEEGQLTHYFNMGVKPLSSELINAITGR